jgi:phosphoribosyl-ATP pyrophosphohydrolase/phosphoribosyl-AMP cyclohydrolase
MLAWMNAESLRCTLAEERAVYWSRSRHALWRKGEQSGNVQLLRELRLDCDGDTLLLRVEQRGGIACHTGREHCFYRRWTRHSDSGHWEDTGAVLKRPAELYGDDRADADILAALDAGPAERRAARPGVLLRRQPVCQGPEPHPGKVGEEATEVILAARDHAEATQHGATPEAQSALEAALIGEVADLWFHSLVLLAQRDLSSQQVLDCLAERFGLSGHEEKAARGR